MEIIRGMPEAEYRARPEISQSTLKLFGLPTLAHAQYEMERAKLSTESMTNGTCLHALVLEGKKIFAVEPRADGRTKEGKAIKAAFAEENAGKIILTSEAAEAVEGMAAGIKRNKGAMLLLESATDREVSIFWDGMKARLDAVCALGVEDIKTTKGASLWDFGKSLHTFGYHIQAAHYLEAAAVAGLPADDFYIIAVENVAPYECALYKTGHASLEVGARELARLRDLYNSCRESGEYPGYSPEPVEINIPAWAMKEANQ